MSAPIGVPTQRIKVVKQSGKTPLLRTVPSTMATRRTKSPVNLPTSRQISTNSRIKKEDHNRKNLYLSFINNALQQKNMGKGEPFEELIGQFTAPLESRTPIQIAQLTSWVQALSNVVSQLERPHSALVEAILALRWTTMENAFVKAYIEFVGMLVSARPEYLTMVLGSAVKGLSYQSGLRAIGHGIASTSSQPLTRRLVYERLHNLLEHVLTLIPTLSSTLEPILVRNFPHKRQEKVAQVTYIKNLLRISEYCLELSGRILALIVDRALQIDVEVQGELEELETVQEVPLFPFDPFDNVVGGDAESSDSDDEDSEADNLSDISSDVGGELGDDKPPPAPIDEAANAAHVQDMVGKLDAILTLIFEHFNRSEDVKSFDDVDPTIILEKRKATQRTQFVSLLSIFDRTILRTFKSRYTQFLLFWYSSRDSEFADLFLGFLVSKALLEADQPSVTRAAAASYIASFVSRAQFVDQTSTQKVVALLCEFLAHHLDFYDALAQSGPDVDLPVGATPHSVFYAVTQAIFLIFCFRWRDLFVESIEDEPDTPKSWIPELGVVQRVLTSSLNPLKVCSTNVVTQFARVSQHAGFVYCYTILESNRRSEHSNMSSSQELTRPPPTPILIRDHPNIVAADLNTFFPFDPYKLHQSSSYIDGVYREWAAVAIEDDEDDDDDDSSGDGEGSASDQEDEDDFADFRISLKRREARQEDPDPDAEMLGASFGGMSISPRRAGLP